MNFELDPRDTDDVERIYEIILVFLVQHLTSEHEMNKTENFALSLLTSCVYFLSLIISDLPQLNTQKHRKCRCVCIKVGVYVCDLVYTRER